MPVFRLLRAKRAAAMEKMDDLQLIGLYHAGNQEAIAVIFKRYYDELFHLGYSILIDKISIDEIISKVLEGYLNTPRKQRKVRYNITSNVRGFLRRTIVRRCIDFNRKKSNQIRKSQLEVAHPDVYPDVQPWTEPEATYSELTGYEVDQLLEKILDRLGGKEREVFDLHVQGYSHEEICELLNITTTRNVSSTLYNARQKAKTVFTK
ncbi:MAG: sigma-70 family RNA polymerase sigma factor [Bacteroidia bacterium]